jgi:hypothetical protein
MLNEVLVLKISLTAVSSVGVISPFRLIRQLVDPAAHAQNEW